MKAHVHCTRKFGLCFWGMHGPEVSAGNIFHDTACNEQLVTLVDGPTCSETQFIDSFENFRSLHEIKNLDRILTRSLLKFLNSPNCPIESVNLAHRLPRVLNLSSIAMASA